MIKYDVSFANYPTSFKGYVVSPTKICLQFNNVTIKTRPHGDTSKLIKTGPENELHALVSTLGTEIKCTAIGCQMPVVEDYQVQLIDAYKKYYRLYSKVYKETYNKDFRDFIATVASKFQGLLSEMDKEK